MICVVLLIIKMTKYQQAGDNDEGVILTRRYDTVKAIVDCDIYNENDMVYLWCIYNKNSQVIDE